MTSDEGPGSRNFGATQKRPKPNTYNLTNKNVLDSQNFHKYIGTMNIEPKRTTHYPSQLN